MRGPLSLNFNELTKFRLETVHKAVVRKSKF